MKETVKQNRLADPPALRKGNTMTYDRNIIRSRRPAFWLSAAAVMAALVLTACRSAGQTPQPIPTPISIDNNNGKDSSGPAAPFSTLPQTEDLIITREGFTDLYPAHLVVSELGYAMYVSDDFELVHTDEGDLIRPTQESSLLQSFSISLSNADAEAHTLDIEMSYPPEGEGGGAVIMQAMCDSIVWPDGTASIRYSNAVEEYLFSPEGKQLLDAAYQAVLQHLNELGTEYQYINRKSIEFTSPSEPVYMSYEMLMAGEEDSWTYASIELAMAEDGNWTVARIGLEK